MAVILVELTIFVFVSLSGVGLDFSRPLNEFFELNLCQHLGDGRIEGHKYEVRSARWSSRAFVVDSSGVSV